LGYFKFYTQVVADLERAGKSVAVFSLTYTLAPEAIYPTQLRQAVTAVRYILSQPNRDPSTVFLGGDSAGGNLACGVLSHLAHPHPEIEPLTLGANKLGGAAMIAPWTLLDSVFPPEQIIYDGGDLITVAVAGPWSKAYLSDTTRDYYTDLSHAPTEWFSTFPVEKVLITGGGNEIMLPIIRDFAEKFQEGFPDVEFFVGHRECHVAPVYNLELGSTEETEQGKKIKSWLRELLK
jgi:acetyl esterase/lipase